MKYIWNSCGGKLWTQKIIAALKILALFGLEGTDDAGNNADEAYYNQQDRACQIQSHKDSQCADGNKNYAGDKGGRLG